MLTTSNDELFQKILGLASGPEDDFLELGAALSSLLDNVPNQFKDLIGGASLTVRRAYFLVHINRAFGALSIPNERLRALGWVKLQLLVGSIDADNAEALLHMAETNSTANLRKLLSITLSSVEKGE